MPKINSAPASRPEFLPLTGFQKALIWTSIIYSVLYFTWRGFFTVDTVSHPVYSWGFFIFDAFGFISSLFFMTATWRIRKRESIPMTRDYSVDVFIPTINESLDLLRTTISHVKKMDYPHETYVLDDGRRPGVRALAAEMGVHYLARNHSKGAKAGNLNHALSQTRGELIAIFDADGIPRTDFITKLLGYFGDEKVALVQTPNAFYNLDSFQHWSENSGKNTWHEQALWYDVILRGLDYDQAATWCGSGSVIRRSSFEAIGGIPTKSVTEDTLATLRLHQAGFDTVYHDEPIAFSLAPSTIEPYLVQRGRWALGSIQVLRDEFFKIVFSKKLPFAKKNSYLISIFYFTSIQKLFYYTAPFIYLCLGVSPVLKPDTMAIPSLLYIGLSISVYQILARGTARVFRGEMYFMHLVPVYLKSIALGLIPFFKGRFKVTPKGNDNRIHPKLWIAPLSIFTLSTFALGAGVLRYLDGESLGDGTLVTMGVAFYYMIASLGSLMCFGKGPLSHKNHSFFDYRPLKILSQNGNFNVNEPFGVSFMISETAIQFIHKGEMKVGEKLELNLDLPGHLLFLSGQVSKCEVWESRGIEPLYIIEIALDTLSEDAKHELSLYFFEHATPKAMQTTANLVRKSPKKVSKANSRRRHVRMPTVAPAIVSGFSSIESMVGMVVDVSTSGALLRLPTALDTGSVIQVSLPWTRSHVVAKVMRTQKELGQVSPATLVGIAFDDEAELEFRYMAKFYKVLETDAVKIRIS